jgi:antitoxin (DNA-binding transcriptional repressor) of toxin-antitoxin stability system
MNASIADLHYWMKDVLRAIDCGESVTILYRGEKKARLVPAQMAPDGSNGGPPRTRDQPLFGLWSDRDDLADPASWLRELRRRPIAPADPESEIDIIIAPIQQSFRTWPKKRSQEVLAKLPKSANSEV